MTATVTELARYQRAPLAKRLDRGALPDMLAPLAVNYGQVISPEVLALFWAALADLPEADVRDALRAHLLECKWWPKVSEIRDLAFLAAKARRQAAFDARTEARRREFRRRTDEAAAEQERAGAELEAAEPSWTPTGDAGEVLRRLRQIGEAGSRAVAACVDGATVEGSRIVAPEADLGGRRRQALMRRVRASGVSLVAPASTLPGPAIVEATDARLALLREQARQIGAS